MKKAWIAAVLLLTLLPVSAFANVDESDAVYRILDEAGQEITQFAGSPEPGDEYVAGDNGYFRITRVSAENQTAWAQRLGSFELPDVSWLDDGAQPVSTQRRAVALYCTHSDESYEPGDGKSSITQRGGIYDVAETLKGNLEKKGITVYYSDENHYPHDAGAYRRSRATASALAEEGVDAIFDIHRDGIPDASQYKSSVGGEDVTKVRLLVGRANQNADANKQFAAQIKAVADKLYPGLIKDIYFGKGTYNQDLMSQSVLLEFGTHKSQKDEVLHSTDYMANVLSRTLYGGVSGAAGGDTGKAARNTGGWKGILWLIGLLVIGALVFAFAATGRGREAMHKWKRTFQEMTGGVFGGKRGDS